MKRSDINHYIRKAEDFFRINHFSLPPFASWTLAEWKEKGDEIDEILDCELGWDVTDFGKRNYLEEGLFLFTIRNGLSGSRKYPKTYAEKVMISHENQITSMHYHATKTEDIINRAGGRLVFELYHSAKDNQLDIKKIVTVSRDGVRYEVQPGVKLLLEPGESLSLPPRLYHTFYAEKGTGPVMIGEISFVNDDHTDNIFLNPQIRFPEIEEDELPYRLLVCDYRKFFRKETEIF